MIKINLTPVEELEDELWWMLDAVVFGATFGLSALLVLLYLAGIKIEIDNLNQSTSELKRDIQAIQGDVDRYDDLSKKIKVTGEKRNNLMRITESQLVRFMPIILIENLQNLKPKGLWFTKLEIDSGKKDKPRNNQSRSKKNKKENTEKKTETPARIEIVGAATSHAKVSRFMASLRSTQEQEATPDDVRTQVYFKDLVLKVSEKKTIKIKKEEREVSLFKLTVSYAEREAKPINQDKLNKFMRSLEE